MHLARIPGWNRRIDIDPDGFRLGIFMHGFEAHLAAVTRGPHAAEGRARIDPLVAIDPDHAGLHMMRHAMSPADIGSPQTAAKSIGRPIGDAHDLVIILEGG